MSLLRLIDSMFLYLAKPELDGIVAIVLHGLVLDYDIIAGLDNRHGNDLAFLGEDLCHTKFPA